MYVHISTYKKVGNSDNIVGANTYWSFNGAFEIISIATVLGFRCVRHL